MRFFTQKNLLWESLSCCSAACSNYCQKKKKKTETNPHLQKGASLRMKMKALLQSSVPYPTGDPLEKLSSSTPFYPQCRVTWVLSKCIKICQNAPKSSKCIKTYQNVLKCIKITRILFWRFQNKDFRNKFLKLWPSCAFRLCLKMRAPFLYKVVSMLQSFCRQTRCGSYFAWTILVILD